MYLILKKYIKVTFLLFVIFTLSFSVGRSQEDFAIFTGKIVDIKQKAVPYAIVMVVDINKVAVADEDGNFVIKSIPAGEHEIQINSLGFAKLNKKILFNRGENNKIFTLKTQSYALKDVNVTAKQINKSNGTSYNLNIDAIEHEQVTSLSDVMTLLPGGQTFSKNLVSGGRRRVAIRSEQNEADRPSFGTVIEIDGIRLSNNALFSSVRTARGVDARMISTDNIENIEVVTGLPSVEYGDLTSGLIKVKTKMGVTPLNIKLSSSPRQKHAAVSQGFRIGKNAGVLNIGYDFTKSTSNIASPYTHYTRNAFTLKHRKIFGSNTGKPLTISSTLAGNVGGYSSEADPDEFNDSYTKIRSSNIRAGVDINWKLNSKLISKINLAANVNYTDKNNEEYYYKSAATSSLAFHGTEEGYFVGEKYDANKDLSPIQILKRGHWTQTEYDDSKPINYAIKLKFNKLSRLDKITNKLKFGFELAGSGNMGEGVYYQNRAYTPTWYEQKYKDEPYLNNLAAYLEEQFSYRLNKHHSITFTAGLRNDYSIVKDSRYKNVSALSPRFNLRHNVIENKGNNKFIKNLSWYASWGQAVKLPTFGMLYTRPSYNTRLAFVPGSLADGTTYYAYYLEPNIILKNKNLKWQKNQQFEIGIHTRLKKISLSVAYFNTRGLDQYRRQHKYIPFTYYLTTPKQLTNVKIPYEDRSYSISGSGTVVVHDKTGVLPDEILEKKEKRSFKTASYTDNGSPVYRHGVEWVIDFGKIKALHTSLRLDGKYYFYKYLNTNIIASALGDNQVMSNGQHYQYVGYYYGDDRMANGRKTQHFTANATFITHIPKLRLIFSLKLEGTFINMSQNLSEMEGGDRSFAIDELGQTLPPEVKRSIYEGNSFAALYPLYYTSFDDMNTKISFKEKYVWAYYNDKVLFNDLSKMVKTTNRTYFFGKSSITPYFSANINVSKEIGDKFKISFYAINLFNTMAKVRSKQENIEFNLLNSYLVTSFSYGMSLQMKF